MNINYKNISLFTFAVLTVGVIILLLSISISSSENYNSSTKMRTSLIDDQYESMKSLASTNKVEFLSLSNSIISYTITCMRRATHVYFDKDEEFIESVKSVNNAKDTCFRQLVVRVKNYPYRNGTRALIFVGKKIGLNIDLDDENELTYGAGSKQPNPCVQEKTEAVINKSYVIDVIDWNMSISANSIIGGGISKTNLFNPITNPSDDDNCGFN